MRTVGELGELEVIRRLAGNLPGRADVVLGAGDDCAVVRPGGHQDDLLLTSDPVIEGIHFDETANPEAIGHKAVGRVLSDIAAMGGEPLWALVNVAARAGTDWARIEGAYRGAGQLADRYGMALVGGDTSRAEGFQLHLFAVGRAPRGAAVTRGGARPGDLLYVTGELGGSRAGKHLRFEPRIEEGLWLREEGWAHAMIDVTDGLAADLRHIMEQSGVGAEVEVAALPVAEHIRTAGPDEAVARAMNDGEDFELLFALAADHRKAFESSWADTFELPCACIGRVTENKGALMLVKATGERAACRETGFHHYDNAS